MIYYRSAARRIGVLGGAAVSGAALLAAGETQALAFDFTDSFWNATVPGQYGSAYIKDTGTPANDYNSHPYGKITYTSPSAKMTMGPNGVTRFGAHNLCLHSNTFSNAIYTKVGGTIAAENISDPYGGNAAAHYLTSVATSVTNGLSITTAGNVGLLSGFQYIIRVRLKDNGTNAFPWTEITTVNPTNRTYVNVATGAVGTLGHVSCTPTSLGGGWYEYTLVTNVLSGAGQLYVTPRGADNNAGAVTGDGVSGFYVTRWQVGRTPSDDTYLATTTTARYVQPFEWSAAGVLQGIVPEEARTELTLYNSDFTNAAWTKSNMATAKTATGPDGVASSATTLTASADNATALQAITSGSAARITGTWIKRRTGTGNIDITQDNGSTWTTVTVTAGWTLVSIASVTSTNPTVGVRIVTNADAVDVALFSHQLGTFLESAIPTIAATVTRAEDNDSLATSAFCYSATDGTLIVRGRTAKAAGTQIIAQLDDTTENERYRIVRDSSNDLRFIVTDGGVEQANINLGAVANDTEFRVGVTWSANDFAATLNGGTVGTDASGTLPNVTTLRPGRGATANSQIGSTLAKMLYTPRRTSNADLQAKVLAA